MDIKTAYCQNAKEVLKKYSPEVIMYDSLTATMFLTSNKILRERSKKLTEALMTVEANLKDYKWYVGSNNYRKLHKTPMRRRWRRA